VEWFNRVAAWLLVAYLWNVAASYVETGPRVAFLFAKRGCKGFHFRETRLSCTMTLTRCCAYV